MTRTIPTSNLVNDNTPINLPTGLEFQKGQTNRLLLQAAWKAAGLAPNWPVDTRGAFALLRIMGYDAQRQFLDYHLARNYFQAPRKEGGQFVWLEADVIGFADSLESTRNWMPLHASHIHKLTPAERINQQFEVSKHKAAFEAFSQMQPLELINLLVTSDQQETRELLGCALKAMTGLLHVRASESAAPLPADAN